jgi:hypothetical protein
MKNIIQNPCLVHLSVDMYQSILTGFKDIMFTPARDFLLETPWMIIFPNPNVNSHSLLIMILRTKKEPFILCISQA